MEVLIRIRGQIVSVAVSDEVYECLEGKDTGRTIYIGDANEF